jgi:hypothetical protein
MKIHIDVLIIFRVEVNIFSSLFFLLFLMALDSNFSLKQEAVYFETHIFSIPIE